MDLRRAQIRHALGYVPDRTWVGNQIYLLSVLLAHNLGRELQMIAHPPSRATLEKRPAFWAFERLDTFRRRIIQRAGRLIRTGAAIDLQRPRENGSEVFPHQVRA